ncbi:MAG: beta-galactosidase [Bryobacteraceae bacterium]|nr:beta-galactosidase [Bryobacteraceae bacterium]
MGAKRGSGKRFEVPYTLEVETSHVKWANPLPGGPIRLLAVPTVGEGRTLIELAQRLSLDLTTVTIDPAWDLNKWTMSFNSDYGARAERGDLKLIYSYLEEELTSDKRFDAVMLPLSHGWKRLTAASHAALSRRVEQGCGLILIRPFESELAPLVPLTPAPIDEEELERPAEPGQTEKSPWKRAGDHYLTRALPLETFPSSLLSHYACSPAPGAEVLISTESGRPIAALKTHGKGRVIGFSYRNSGVSWHMPMDARNGFVDVYFEYFYAMLCRALIFCARREPAVAPDFSRETTRWRLRDRYNIVRRSGSGQPPATPGLPPGRYFLEQEAESDWRVKVVDTGQPPKVENLRASKDLISSGDSVEVSWTAGWPVLIELVDALGRVIAREKGEGQVTLHAGRPLVHSGWVRARLGDEIEQIPVRFTASSREWTDYEVVLPWYGPRSYQPWISAVDNQFRRIGITTLASPDRNFRIMVSAHLSAFGIYHYRRDAYLKRKKAYAETGETKYLTRDITLQSPEFERGVKQQLNERVRPAVALKPFAYYLAEESSLTCYTDTFDVDWDPHALRGFREWLCREYVTLENLNRNWGLSLTDWDSVLPITTAEAQKHGNFAPWSDHRIYMESEFVAAFDKAISWLREIDPEARGSISGTQAPTAHNGCNWYEINQRLDYIQPYSGGSQDAMHHLFKPGLLITGFTGYGVVEEAAHSEQWRRLFYGHTGASIFWQYTLLNPDLTLSEQGKALAEAFSRMQSGIGKLFQHTSVMGDGVAIHFSMASLRGAWITEGSISGDMQRPERASKATAELMKRRGAWVQTLERQGVQFRFLASEQIESEALKDCKVLILPYSIALSDREIAAIDAFLDGGGIIHADEHTGRMDEKCRWRARSPWTAARKGVMRQGPSDLGIRKPVTAASDALTTVRRFGRSTMLGILPTTACKIQAASFAQPGHEVYDLLRGGVAATELDASPSQPLLLIERESKIARLEMGTGLDIRLTDDKGAPVDLSVIHIEAYSPEGVRIPWYASNVLLENGTAQARIPFALCDARGEWRIHACDIVSGLKAERRVRPTG